MIPAKAEGDLSKTSVCSLSGERCQSSEIGDDSDSQGDSYEDDVLFGCLFSPLSRLTAKVHPDVATGMRAPGRQQSGSGCAKRREQRWIEKTSIENGTT